MIPNKWDLITFGHRTARSLTDQIKISILRNEGYP